MNELKLADLGEGMHEAEIVEWLVTEGDTVRLDQPVVRVETDKAIVEIPSPVGGRITEVRFQPGQTVKVGEVMVVYESAQSISGDGNGTHPSEQPLNSSATSEQMAPKPSEQPLNSSATSEQMAPKPSAPPSSNKRTLAAPAVRKRAFELKIELSDVTPSLANGRITMDDLDAHLKRVQSEPPEETKPEPALVESRVLVQSDQEERREPLTGLRKRIAEHMERSWRSIPHATAFDEFDARGLVALRTALLPATEKRAVRLTYMPLLLKLLIPVLKEFPIFNASLDEEKHEIVYHHTYHLGVATASSNGLLVPVLRDADKLSVMEIAARLEQLIEGAKKRTLALNELSGSTFTLNNIGSFGGNSGTPIINHPEVAILAVGRIVEKAVVQDGAIVIQARLPLALSFDHRLIDGALSGAFLGRLKELIEAPQQLLLDLI